ncbi:hypothetical protein [Amycolatopsis sp. BJA-103]|uniref:hypothetical protein n=1 Tax=Amycolatopsis sp. BJA-103 TaxID=1911175 RepID=UPI000C78A14E|nr:hypothetical protein [Amycolatopsis sp. BJA-103]AUI56761.1 hypothetical protein BKN51_00070 [Amycolatopsis sp. BJA-103]AUI56823.1 hypothetical protein BKN51_00400 [Amycolatopsis sp. BJA-103]PNE13466.1 hypothetical protein B1H26_40270 [Amycolatopsis sp. BJA-103]
MTSNELAVTEQQARGVPVALGAKQSDFDATYRLAKNLAMSGLLPSAVRGKAADVLVMVLYGQELGLAPMQAINSIYVVEGRPAISVHLWVALARKAGHKVRIPEETATSCTVEVERSDDPGHPTRVTYTLDQAKTAGLANRNTWKSHPSQMLYARAASTAIRRACPEVVMGFADEYEVAQPEPERPSLGQVVAEREDRAAEQRAVVVDAETVEPEPAAEDIGPTAEELAELADDFARPAAAEALFDPDAEL